ncbi:RICIN domain-containing protein [Actinacidiphila sp. bgisy145]|uniref:RICIN domain-containing protein n=1 Tax=Actinacidiphila sp. bgisy145 TaxID=3413792 RepID=UPI003EB9B3E0
MPHPRTRLAVALLAAALAVVGAGAGTGATAATATTTAAASPAASGYTVSVGTTGSYAYPTDTPASSYIDKDGTYYFQQSVADYGTDGPRSWDFFTGTDMDTATRSGAISDAVNPAEPRDRNNDTTWRCDNSPTGKDATPAPAGSGYTQRNFCDLVGTWVDPDTGDWYGLVHNEFTPQPFGDGIHFDAIDYAVSTDQGRTWTIKGHALTSPYSTERGDTAAFPQQTYSYGDGDQRLFVDTASGYFYVYYGSRAVDKNGGWKAFYEHVARAPIAAKMAPDSWQKWYDGSWSQPGTGGKESNIVPVASAGDTGYTDPAAEYDPATPGTVSAQVAAGTAPPTSPLFVMDISYDAYLGLYIGEPQAVDQSGNAPQQFYATADLATQKWTLLGDTGGYTTASWYRWMLDSANKTSSTIVGRTFRAYCSIACADGSDGQYANVTIDPAGSAAAPVVSGGTYTIASGAGRVLAARGAGTAAAAPAAGRPAAQSWKFTANGDGSYRITSAATGRALGVPTGGAAGRAWGTAPVLTALPAAGPTVGQQWFVLPGTSADGTRTGTFKLVNRYSGLVLALPATAGRGTETTPARSWSDRTGSAVGGRRGAAEQTLTLTAAG